MWKSGAVTSEAVGGGLDVNLLGLAGVAMLPLATRRLWSRIPGMSELTNAHLMRHALTVLAAGLVPPRRNARRQA